MTFYIYKLTISDTDLYYYGVTDNVERRRSQHAVQIRRFVRVFRVMPSTQRKADCIYSRAAKAFVRGKRTLGRRDALEAFPTSACAIEILHETADIKLAARKESEYIKLAASDPHCLNSQLAPLYNHKNKIQK